jgi:glycosyltransferase involved in cell wall biosynthesis
MNIGRLLSGRKQKNYLSTVYIRASRYLTLLQLVLSILVILNKQISPYSTWLVIVLVALVSSSLILRSVIRTINKTTPQDLSEYLTDKELPSITVALPARNETIDLERCLTSLISSNYPKLEILVLDDCSQDKHTAEIIKRYAQEGVRFVAGKEPPDSWSAKNYAYQRLAEEANGKYIIFCGVDVIFGSNTLRKMIELVIYRKKKMASFIPLNHQLNSGSIKDLSLQPWRYYWELGLPRRRFNRPPVLSTCWVIDRISLEKYGGFKAVSRNILPERYFAGRAANSADSYSFLQSNDSLQLMSDKSYQEQFMTAVRTRYPNLNQRMEFAAGVALIEALIFIFPLAVVMWSLLTSQILLLCLAVATLIINATSFYKVVKLAYRKIYISSLFLVPFLAVFDISMLYYSMWQYEFSEVIWKGRNVCVPVMWVEPKVLRSSANLNSV